VTSLALSDEDIERAGNLLTEFLRTFEQSLTAKPVLPPLDRAVLAELRDRPFPKDGIGIDQLFQEIAAKVVPNSTTIAHPRYLAYVLGPPNGIAPFAEAVAAALNQNCNFWQLSPAASVIERKVISWLAELFGFPKGAGGIITSGGSMATLVAMATAIQDKFSGDFRKAGLQAPGAPLVVYTSEEAHRCVEKSAAILGLGLDNVRKIPVGSEFRMRADLLAAAIRQDRESGKQPFCVVAAAGTINTGAIDPLDEIADLCAAQNLWLHVDGAYGALFVLSPRIKEQLLPCSRADSIALDPHKLLFAPLEAGCVIVRDREKLRHAFGFSASYIPDQQDPLFTNFMDYGPQLSRSFKAFKIWCSLQVFGVNAFVAAAEHMLDIARYMGGKIQADAQFELMAPVKMSAVCFRLRNASDAENQRILTRLIEEGTALLGPVRIGAQFGMRACITNYRTTREDIDLILDRLRSLYCAPAPIQ
jgi:aromatic-L-amino-acid decarboxylase